MLQQPEQPEISDKDIKVARELIKKAKREEYKSNFPDMKRHIEEWERKAYLENDTESAKLLEAIHGENDDEDVFNEAPDVFLLFLVGSAIIECFLVDQDLEFLSDHARLWVNYFAEDERLRNAKTKNVN
jgi:hypothetical protein